MDCSVLTGLGESCDGQAPHETDHVGSLDFHSTVTPADVQLPDAGAAGDIGTVEVAFGLWVTSDR